MRRIDVILHSPEHPGNIGAIARAMKNFGFNKLTLINPQTNHLDEEARRRAKHATNILEEATILQSEQELTHDLIIATTGKTASTNNIARQPITPKELREELNNKQGTIALLLGRESYGLTNKEIEQADILVTIPTKGVLNLSHATTILLYELSQLKTPTRKLATKEQKEQLEKNINLLINNTNLPDIKKEQQQKTWKKLFANNYLSGREAQAIIGLLKKLL